MIRAALALSITVPLAASACHADVTTERITTSDQLTYATEVTFAPGDFTRLFIIERQGRVRILNLKTGQLNQQPFLDATDDVSDVHWQHGLFGIAFHPNYPNDRRFFVSFLNETDDSEVRAYLVHADDPDRADHDSGETIIEFTQPTLGHSAHWIGFGPDDGMLYISSGDGGIASSAQQLDSLTGNMLRIDIDDPPPGQTYRIPPDNPFLNEGRAEIWSYGLRNPWGCAFDRLTGDLYIGDVGESNREEINVQPAGVGGQNYGWDCMEGNICFSGSGCECHAPELTDPIHVYAHVADRCSISGGIVYRGCRLPEEHGRYFFGDHCSREIWSLRWDGEGGALEVNERTGDLFPPEGFINDIVNFGEDAWGAMYIVEGSGEIWRMRDAAQPIRWADLDCDNTVAVADLLILLGNWGDCVGCRGDITGDDVTDVADLLALLSDWG